MSYKVWIDQDLCTGDGICAELCPKVFVMGDDGLAYVRTPAGEILQGATGTAEVPPAELEAAIEAAEECPGDCIFFDPA